MEIKKYPITIHLYKHGQMQYFSQLDIMRCLERALRRTELPLYFTQGFNPHVKISFHNGLKLGKKGILEITLYFTQAMKYPYLKKKLQTKLPRGLTLTSGINRFLIKCFTW